jgi:sec-independent protein translocase protein TatA
MIGFGQLLIIILVILLLFGSGRISKLMYEIGLGMKAFRQGLTEEKEIKKKSKLRRKSNTNKITNKKK